MALGFIDKLLLFILEGIVICVSDEQLSNALLPIELTEEGFSNVICLSDEQL